MADGIYQRHRPKKIEDVIGQPQVVKAVQGFGKDIPHAVLLYGNSGAGKTSTARIMADAVGCSPHSFDLCELNCATIESPLDCVKDIERGMWSSSLHGKSRVWILDETQALSRARFAQEGLLKILEDGPKHCYFFLCTTDPKKLIPAIRNRCTSLKFNPVPEVDLERLVKKVADAEKGSVSAKVVSQITKAANGSPRVALVELEKVLGLRTEAEQLEAVSPVGDESIAFDLVKVLIPFKGSPDWESAKSILTGLADQDPEGLRMMILSCCKGGLLKEKGGSQRAFQLYRAIRCLDQPLYDKVSGWALLTAGCYEICFGTK